MFDRIRQFALNYWVADMPAMSPGERGRSALGALLGLLLTALLVSAASTVFPLAGDARALIAPMGASAVILFALPLSPLAQPWSVLGGYLVATLTALACAWLIPHALLAAALAVALAIWFSSRLRCLHPPSGALAILIVFDHQHAPGHSLELIALALGNVVAIILAALIVNKVLLRRRYPHCRALPNANAASTATPRSVDRVGLTHADLSAAVQQVDSFLDIQDDDLLRVYRLAIDHAFERHLGLRCGDVMHRDTPTLEFASELQETWDMLRGARIKALPVVDHFSKRLLGIVTLDDFLRQIDGQSPAALPLQMRGLLKRTPELSSEKAEVVGQIMTPNPFSVSMQTPVVDLVQQLIDHRLHHVPVVDEKQRFVGMISPGNLIAALYQHIALERSRS
jgi:CBS domain-containing membrane protein